MSPKRWTTATLLLTYYADSLSSSSICRVPAICRSSQSVETFDQRSSILSTLDRVACSRTISEVKPQRTLDACWTVYATHTQTDTQTHRHADTGLIDRRLHCVSAGHGLWALGERVCFPGLHGRSGWKQTWRQLTYIVTTITLTDATHGTADTDETPPIESCSTAGIWFEDHEFRRIKQSDVTMASDFCSEASSSLRITEFRFRIQIRRRM